MTRMPNPLREQRDYSGVSQLLKDPAYTEVRKRQETDVEKIKDEKAKLSQDERIIRLAIEVIK